MNNNFVNGYSIKKSHQPKLLCLDLFNNMVWKFNFWTLVQCDLYTPIFTTFEINIWKLRIGTHKSHMPLILLSLLSIVSLLSFTSVLLANCIFVRMPLVQLYSCCIVHLSKYLSFSYKLSHCIPVPLFFSLIIPSSSFMVSCLRQNLTTCILANWQNTFPEKWLVSSPQYDTSTAKVLMLWLHDITRIYAYTCYTTI